MQQVILLMDGGWIYVCMLVWKGLQRSTEGIYAVTKCCRRDLWKMCGDAERADQTIMIP